MPSTGRRASGMAATATVAAVVVVALLAAGAPAPAAALGLDDLADILQVGREIIKSVFSAWRIVDETHSGPEEAPSMFNKNEQRLLGHIVQVGIQTERLEQNLAQATRSLARTIHDLERTIDVKQKLRDLAEDYHFLNDQYAVMRRYVEHGYDNHTDAWTLERHTLEDLAVELVSHRPRAPRNVLARLHRSMLVVPAMLPRFREELKILQCNVQQSPQQVIYNLYNVVALSELKGFAMMQFSWMLLRLYNKGNFTQEATLLRDTFEERGARQVEAVRAAMTDASRSLWRCDPDVHREGETYEQLTRLVQGHVQNEVDMNHDRGCGENCAYYSYAQSTGCYDGRICDAMHRCNGRLLECQFIASDMWVCQSNQQTARRYEWLQYENGRTLGRPGTCERRRFKVDSWWRWLFWHCSYCFCLCDEPGPRSDRYFNLRPVLADTANNMVVTGLRFVKKNRVIHLQIREGALLPRGAINASSVRWRPVDDYRISDGDVQNGRDFHTLSWEQRAIDLDDLEAPPGHVVTGFRFRHVGSHLNPEIMVTPLNFSAGALVKPNEKSMWMSNDNTDGAMVAPRTQVKLLAPDVPTNSHAGSTPDSRSDQYLLFTHSDIDADAAQTTVPFLDAQPVAPEPAVPLAGAGIYHKGTPRYGGFVAPHVSTYDFSVHLHAVSSDPAPAPAPPPDDVE